MPSVSSVGLPLYKFFDNNGKPLASGRVQTKLAGSNTDTPTYVDASGSVPNQNPIILDARGEAVVWLDPTKSYDLLPQSAAGVAMPPINSVIAPASTALANAALALGPNLLSSDPSKGSSLVTYSSVGGVARTAADKFGEWVSVRDRGANGDGVVNDAASLATAVASLLVPPGVYRVSTNTIITASMTFVGGIISVDSGVTLTINSNIHAPSKILFQGLGTVIINCGEIDVAWFDGTDASSKWAFCARGIQNTNGLGKVVVFSKPAATDAWATIMQIGGNGVWGPRWKVDAPIVIGSAQQATVIRTLAGFVATTSMLCMWQIGAAADPLKVDYCHFPDKLSIEGNNGTCTYAGIMYGTSHMRIPYQEIYRTAGWLFQPTVNKQVSDVKFDFMDTGMLWGPVLTLDGSAGANNTITDCVFDFISSTGFATGHAPNALVQLNSNYNGIHVGKVVHRAVVAGAVDATGAVVSITNVGATAPGGVFYPPRYDIHIGPVLNGSTTIAAYAISFSDQSAGAAAKFGGVVIEAGSLVDGGALAADITVAYSTGVVVQGLTKGRKLSIASTSDTTQVSGMDAADVIDGGASTLINGRSKQLISPITVSASPFDFVNNAKYDIDVQWQGGTVSAVTLTRGATVLSLYSGAALNSALFRLSPGDSVQTTYSVLPTMNVIPR